MVNAEPKTGRVGADHFRRVDEIFRLLVQNVQDYSIFFLLDPEGYVSSWNAGAERIKGYSSDEILGKHFSVFYPEEAIARNWPAQELKLALKDGRFEDEGWRIRKDGSRFWANVVITPLYREGILQGFAKVARDLTERRLAEQQLRASEERYRLLVSGIKDYAIYMLDPKGHIVTWNEGAEAIKGYTTDQVIGKHFSLFYPEETVRNRWPERELQLAEQQGRFVDEGWRIRRDGSRFWASVVITPLHDANGQLYGYSKITRDATERMQWEEKIQQLNRELRNRVEQLDESRRLIELRTVELQKLSAQLMRVQDEERRRVARELHDELGQELAGVKMLLESDSSGTNAGAIELTERSIQTVRNISYLLHPPLLDEAGLLAALTWYVQGMTKRSGIEVALEVKPIVFQRLSAEIETTVFRIVQESLTNVYPHSVSQKASVVIERQPEAVILRIRDYGKGISAEIASGGPSNSLGVGISGMRERVKQLGGQLLLYRTEPGTLVHVRIPILNAVTTDIGATDSAARTSTASVSESRTQSA